MYPTLVAIHVVAACIWVGGALFLGGIALPVARGLSHDESRRYVIQATARRFRFVGWLALGALVGTGLYLASRWGMTWSNAVDLSFFAAEGRTRVHLLGYKLLAVLALLVTSFVHDWIVGPRTGRAREGTERRERLQKWSAILGVGTAVLSIVVVVLGVWMVRGV